MTIIGWLVTIEIIVSIGLLVWVLIRTHKRIKKSPAEQALQRHLAELELAKTEKKPKK